MKFRRRQLVLASLVLALGAAVYLNWQFSDDKGLFASDILQSQKELGEARYVNSKSTSMDDNLPVETISAMPDSAKEYFAQARLNRQKARDEATEMVKNILSDVKSDEHLKAETAKQVSEATKLIQQESNIENLIKAKGFSDCLAFIQNGECNIVVNPNTLNESYAVAIRDIVSGQSGIAFDKIKIVEAK